jgi:ABC-2 type transport system permease protein
MSHKLRAVIRHEYLTIVRQPGFLLTLIGIPVLMIAVGAISVFAERTSMSSIEDASEDLQNVVVVDQSGLIAPDLAESIGAELRIGDRDSAVADVRDEVIQAAIVYPEDFLDTRQFDVYVGGGDDFITSTALTDVGKQLVIASFMSQFEDPRIPTLILSGASANLTAFQDGEETAGISGYIVPGAFLAVFFVVLFFSMGYMLLSVAEEKENRSMEMVLTYVDPKTLITGKLFAIGLIGLTQILFYIASGLLIGFAAVRFGWLELPFSIDLGSLVFDPVAIITGLVVLLLGFLLYAAVMSGVAAMMPSVKEANSLSSMFYLLALAPLWLIPAIMAAPESAVVKLLTFFPLSSPTTILFRNTVGSIQGAELLGAILLLAISTLASFVLAARLFRIGALEFNDRISLGKVFRR